jgi:hypothetical protein
LATPACRLDFGHAHLMTAHPRRPSMSGRDTTRPRQSRRLGRSPEFDRTVDWQATMAALSRSATGPLILEVPDPFVRSASSRARLPPAGAFRRY